MISGCRIALLHFCILLFLSACPSVPPSSGGTVPPADSSPAAVSEEEDAGSLPNALEKSSVILSGALEPGASVAVVSVTADESFWGEYVSEELTLILVRMQRFRVVDRQNMDIIRAEQTFQISGEVDDDTAVSIGRLIGAAFVITGAVSPEPGLRMPAKRLRLRVLDVQTGQIRAMSSVAFWGDL
jgi:curli biogenesis system outer membrane secretion channel CsgG